MVLMVSRDGQTAALKSSQLRDPNLWDRIVLEQKYRNLRYKHIIGSHFVQELRNYHLVNFDPNMKPIVKKVIYTALEPTSPDCFNAETVIVSSTLLKGTQTWLLSGQYCFQWSSLKLNEMKELSNSDAAYLLQSLSLPPYVNGSKG